MAFVFIYSLMSLRMSLRILSTGELATDRVTLVEAKAGPMVEMLKTRPKCFINENKSIGNILKVTILTY